MESQINRVSLEPRLNAAFIARLYLPFAAGYFLSMLFRVIGSTISPYLVNDFGLDASDLGLMTSTYMLAFALTQYPLGISLDRFGPKRTLIALMAVASAGALVFSRADGLSMLMLGRALIGFGVSGCLMCSFKAYGDWLPEERLPLINAFQMFAGGCGAMAATKSVGSALQYTDWRGVFIILSLLCLLSIPLIFVLTPQKEYSDTKGVPLGQQIRESGQILKSPDFWRLSPLGIMVQATYISVQTLWVAPWFRDVAGIPEGRIADYLFIVSFALTAGYIVNGIICDFFRRFHITTYGYSAAVMALFILSFGLIIFLGPRANIACWCLMIFAASASMLTYSVLSSMFSSSLSGRVITLYNLVIFLFTFFLQWGTGVIIDLFPAAAGYYNPRGYTVAFLIMFALNAMSFLWLIFYRKGKMVLKIGDHLGSDA